MATKQECDKYAAELIQRFEDLTRWAITNWPNGESPLLPSDFNESRREIGRIVGPKLGDGSPSDESMSNGESRQYIDMNPMPWP
ncbi:MAG TPA: hypothetical protein VJ698_13720 [Noviherbaspirillum sp.]|uniref:hypothetical protein n=1 Tax=Noviherbaspirillum sp. TaxID=1926288 RepID=UPI002B45CCFC|nr:hypothetical protein [Noviherbaspirillum sp.]HJV86526.1 hypothetical protein [Noviherbaspirillum sp.]